MDGRGDQYALACMAFALLTGNLPFHRQETMATLFAHLNDPVPPLSYGPVPGGRHMPAEDGALTPELVESILEEATGATHVVVTPWRGVLVPNTAEVSE